jgi:DNA-binding ferritin-like protein
MDSLYAKIREQIDSYGTRVLDVAHQSRLCLNDHMATDEVVLEKKILHETKKIEHLESEIEKSEERISSNLSSGLQVLSKQGGVKAASLIRRTVLRRMSKHKFIFTALVTLGVVLVWRGLWDVSATIPVLENSTASLFVGFAILWAIEKYTDLS